MADKSIINWEKDGSLSQVYGFDYSPKISGKVKRKGLWNGSAFGEIGTKKFRFDSNGKARMHTAVYDESSGKKLGTLDFYWKDFQRSQLKLADGHVYHFRSFDLFRGSWSWTKDDSNTEQFVFRVDSPLQRAGSIENHSTDVSALHRDILLLLGLHLTHYINNWLLTILIVLIAVASG